MTVTAIVRTAVFAAMELAWSMGTMMAGRAAGREAGREAEMEAGREAGMAFAQVTIATTTTEVLVELFRVKCGGPFTRWWNMLGE